MTYEDFVKAALALLADKSKNTGLKCGPGHLVDNGQGGLLAVADGEGLEDAGDADWTAWDGDAWDGMTAEDVQESLRNPEFKQF